MSESLVQRLRELQQIWDWDHLPAVPASVPNRPVREEPVREELVRRQLPAIAVGLVLALGV